MNLKILVIGIIALLLSSPFFVLAEDVSVESVDEKTVELRVALYTNAKETEKFYSPSGRTGYFKKMLDNYEWKVGDTTYSFLVTLLSDKRLLSGELATENYDVLLYPPGTADANYLNTGLYRLPKNKLRVKLIKDFVENGGGYYGTCGGAGIACTSDESINREPMALFTLESDKLLHRFFSRMWLTSCMGLSCIKNTGTEKWYDTVGLYFIYCSLRNVSVPLTYKPGMVFDDIDEVCLDLPVSKDHAIFDDFLEDTRRVRWASPPQFELPKNPDRKIDVLLRYPFEEISDNVSTQIHEWEYIGGLKGLIKAVKLGRNSIRDWIKNAGKTTWDALAHSSDWRKTNQIVPTNFSNKPFMTSEIYPNSNQARIVLCAGHPEYRVWWGGHIEEVEDTDHNTPFDGFYRWTNVTPEEETIEDEWTYNWWIVIRSVAWASKKVPDNDLPIIYGTSQVCDIYPYEQSTFFSITGNVETSDGITSLDLYYRYRADNESCWNNWTLYKTDMVGSDGWSWEFNASDANETGFYQFYSIRNVEYEGHTETEKVPPGPDAIAHVVE